MSDQTEPRYEGVLPPISRAILGDPTPEMEEMRQRAEERAAHLQKRSEFRERLETVQRTAIAFAYVVIAVLVCAMAYEVWRILHEVTP